MELVKDIYFNTDKLIENTKVKVSYTGKFYQGDNNQVFIHYGYGKDWNNVNEVEMLKTDLGYQTELELLGGDTLNFCFKNQNNEWDNNSGKNYIFNIEKPTISKLGTTTIGVDAPTTTGSFFGKTFGTTSTEPTTNSNVFETVTTTEQIITNNEPTTSGVIEDSIIGNPNSIDAIINTADTISTVENAGNIDIGIPTYGTTVESNIGQTVLGNTTNLDNGITQKLTYNLGVSTPTVGTKFNNTKINIINPVADAIKKTANQAVTIVKKTANHVTATVKNNTNQNTNALAVKPTGFNLWTQKVKASVSKFFSYVPKLISGNYKRKVSENNNNNN